MARMFHATLAALNATASIGIFFLILLISADVFGRALFNMPLHGVPEIVRFALVAMVWLQMAYVLRTGGHLRTTLILDILPQPAKRLVLILNALVGLFLCALIAWLGYLEAFRSWEQGAFEGELPVRIPLWPIWTILLIGSALTAVQFVIDAVRHSRRGSPDVEHPVDQTDTERV